MELLLTWCFKASPTLPSICIRSPARVTLYKITHVKTIALFKTSIKKQSPYPRYSYHNLHGCDCHISFLSPTELLCIHSGPNSLTSFSLFKNTKHGPTSRPWHLALEQAFRRYFKLHFHSEFHQISIQFSTLISPHQRELLAICHPFLPVSSLLPYVTFLQGTY